MTFGKYDSKVHWTIWSMIMCYDVELNQHRNSKIESRIEMHHTILKLLNWSLNKCELDKIDLDRCDIESRWSQDDIDEWVWS
jgi:hypothetical protein